MSRFLDCSNNTDKDPHHRCSKCHCTHANKSIRSWGPGDYDTVCSDCGKNFGNN